MFTAIITAVEPFERTQRMVFSDAKKSLKDRVQHQVNYTNFAFIQLAEKRERDITSLNCHK